MTEKKFRSLNLPKIEGLDIELWFDRLLVGISRGDFYHMAHWMRLRDVKSIEVTDGDLCIEGRGGRNILVSSDLVRALLTLDDMKKWGEGHCGAKITSTSG